MIIYEPMLPEDILSMDIANLDLKSENFSFEYYLDYFLSNPLDFFTARQFSTRLEHTSMIYTNQIIGYIFGKKEIKEELCLHLSALSVGPSYRKSGIGSYLMKMFENNGNSYNAWFCDLFVRESNKVATSFYERIGYSVYRTIYGYYCYPNEDAFDMRKSLSTDIDKRLERPGQNIDSSQI